MSKKKGLNDAIHGDRARIRGYAAPKEPTWDDFEAGPGPAPGSMFRQSQTWGTPATSSKTTGGSLYNISAPSCHESHPPMKLPGDDFVVYGGSCLHPKVKDADVYIGFDAGMRRTERQYPWVKDDEVKFEIADMSTPKDAAAFGRLVDWTAEQIRAGRKVHCGCIGGHGRTGMFLAALVAKFGEKDAIAYVRENYCQKAVESGSQIKFLVERFKVFSAKGSKDWSGGSPMACGDPPSHSSSHSVSHSSSGKKGVKKESGVQVFNPVAGQGCIW
jgi:hypothetical protein